MKKLIIIITTHNRKNLLEVLLQQLQKQECDYFEFKIITVVDGSNDGTIEMLAEKFPNVLTVIGPGTWWFTKSLNKGFKFAQQFHPDYILTFNDDIEIGKDYFKTLTSICKEHADCIIGAVSYTIDKPHRIITSGVQKMIWWRNKAIPYYPFLTKINPSALTGIKKSILLACRGTLIPFHILKELSFFDESFKQYHSDSDFFLRANKAGYLMLISHDLKIFTHLNLSSTSSSFLEHSFGDLIKSFFNPYSRLHIPSMARYLYRHTNKLTFPITFMIFIFATFKVFFINKKL